MEGLRKYEGFEFGLGCVSGKEWGFGVGRMVSRLF